MKYVIALILCSLLLCSCGARSAVSVTYGEQVVVYKIPKYAVDGMQHIAVVDPVGDDAQTAEFLKRALLTALQEQSSVNISEHGSYAQAMVHPKVDSIVLTQFDFTHEVYVLAGHRFQHLSLTVNFQLIRLDRNSVPVIPAIVCEWAVSHDRVLPELSDKVSISQAKAELGQAVCDEFWHELGRQKINANRTIFVTDMPLANLMRTDRWAEALLRSFDQMESTGVLTAEDYYNLALCYESIGDAGALSKAHEFYQVSLDMDTSLRASARAIARLEWKDLYYDKLDEQFFVLQEPPVTMDMGAGVAVIGVTVDSQALLRYWSNGSWEDSHVDFVEPFGLERLTRNALEFSFNRRSPWRHQRFDFTTPVTSVQDLFKVSGGEVFASKNTDYMIFVDVQESLSQRTFIPWREALVSRFERTLENSYIMDFSGMTYVQVTVVKVKPYLEIVGSVSGESVADWNLDELKRTDKMDKFESPLSSRVHLLYAAVEQSLAKLKPSLKTITVRLPDCDAVALELIRAGAYKTANIRLEAMMTAGEVIDSFSAHERAELQYALGLSYEGRGRAFSRQAEAHYLAAIELDEEVVDYRLALARVRKD